MHSQLRITDLILNCGYHSFIKQFFFREKLYQYFSISLLFPIKYIILLYQDNVYLHIAIFTFFTLMVFSVSSEVMTFISFNI